LANVRIKGSAGEYEFQWSFGFGIRLSDSRPGSECQTHSTSRLKPDDAFV
jgi:hypothetical protein